MYFNNTNNNNNSNKNNNLKIYYIYIDIYVPVTHQHQVSGLLLDISMGVGLEGKHFQITSQLSGSLLAFFLSFLYLNEMH